MSLAKTPSPPYYAVIFSSQMQPEADGYAQTSDEMLRLAALVPGYLGVESARESGFGITVSYWETLEAIAEWRRNADHQAAQKAGREKWYRAYALRVARVERERFFGE